MQLVIIFCGGHRHHIKVFICCSIYNLAPRDFFYTVWDITHPNQISFI